MPMIRKKTAAEVVNCAMSMAPELESTETLTGTPTVTATPSSGAPTFSSIAVTTAKKQINGVSVKIGQAVTCKATGGTAGVDYTISVVCTTSLGQTREGIGILQVT